MCYAYTFTLTSHKLSILCLYSQINGEAIYETVPWKYQNDTAAKDVWYTATRVGIFMLGVFL